MLGTNHKGSLYQKVKPTPGSFYIGDSHKGAEFLHQPRSYKGFTAAKADTSTKDENFKSNRASTRRILCTYYMRRY